MLAKLLKYNMKSTRRFGIPILLILLGVTLFGSANAFFMMTLSERSESGGIFTEISYTGSVFMTIFVFMLIGAAAAAIQVVILVDFYRTLVSDIGYLTFTLPVKPRSILTAKLINSSVWTLLVGIACAFSAALIIFTMIFTGIDGALIPDSEPLLPIGGDSVLMIILGVLFAIAYFINTQLLYFAAIFFSSVITRKNKVLAAVGCVLGVNLIYGIASSVFQILTLLIAESITQDSGSLLGTNLYLAFSTLVLTALSVLFFLLTEYMMKKKINLE